MFFLSRREESLDFPQNRFWYFVLEEVTYEKRFFKNAFIDYESVSAGYHNDNRPLGVMKDKVTIGMT